MEAILAVLRAIWIIFLVLMVFNLMIIVHEWGHFLAGRWRGLVIDRFQIWFGKPIWKKTINGVQYGLGSIPAGGFVSLPQMVTMESIEGEVDEETKKALPPISPLDKIIVAFAGPLFSFLLAVVFALAVWAVKKPVNEYSGNTTVGVVVEGGPADKAGIELFDKIISIDGAPIKRFNGMTDSVLWAVVSSEEPTISIEVERDGEMKTIEVEVPRPEPEVVEGSFLKKAWAKISSRPPLPQIGLGAAVSPVVAEVYEDSPAAVAGLKKGDRFISIDGKPTRLRSEFAEHEWKVGEPSKVEVERVNGKRLTVEIAPEVPIKPEESDPMIGVKWAQEGVMVLVRQSPVEQISDGARGIVNTINKVFFSPKSGIGAGHLSGPVGIMGVYYDLFTHPDGWRLVLWFSVVLNINLAFLNLLPFPVLDGGHIVMAITEWIRKKPLPIQVLNVVQTGFVLLLFGYMIFITFKDVGDRVGRAGKPSLVEPVFSKK